MNERLISQGAGGFESLVSVGVGNVTGKNPDLLFPKQAKTGQQFLKTGAF